ncbi:polysaccharide lyase family protein [Luteolibacter yonseiensis]|uniref:polysaccharide lyase family protein n=1 Tax=Luteolibacter yonseiensis TaxID=1144680 RepID=UPI0031EB6489
MILTAIPVAAGDVTVTQEGGSFRMSNGALTATIEKRSGRVTAVRLGDAELLGKGTGYWSMAASSGRSRVGGFGVSKSQFVSIDPATNGGERAEVVCEFHGTGADQAYPGKVQIRYSIGRQSTTFYATALLEHGGEDAPFRIGEGRFVIKLDGGVFDQLTIDKDRNWIMPTGADWDAGSPLNLKEARRMTTGRHAGWAEHKYSYSAILEKVPAYGWVGSRRGFGVWMINPSMEYIAGGPTKMELTGHLDVGNGGLPTLLNMWHGSHYGGTVLSLARGEKWSKVIGPFAIHFNKGADPAGLWAAALAEAKVERAAWPYSWVKMTEYPAASGRGGVSGKIRIQEKDGTSPSADSMWVGLTEPEYAAGREGWGREMIGWQRDGKYYQYWVRAQPDGSFSLTGIRPGNYVLHAFADGVMGEFLRKDVEVKSGLVREAGELVWSPERAGPTLWQIGIPDRSAAEFRNGDRYWYWGNYLKYRTDFPNGVDYTVGRSDWRKDWHICQPLELSEDCRVLGDSTWKVRFSLEKVPADGTRLRISFCGSRQGSELGLSLNGSGIGSTGPLPENGTMHRDSSRGYWFERGFDIPAARLREGENVLELRLSGSQWHQGVLYDCLRMEAVSPQEAGAEVDAGRRGRRGIFTFMGGIQ